MQDGSLRILQRFGNNAVLAQRQEITLNPPRAVYPLDFFIGRGFQAPDPVPAEHFHHQAVQVFRAAADDDLVRGDPDAPVAGQVAAERFTEGVAAGVRRLDQEGFTVIRQDPAHDLCQGREGKGVPAFRLRNSRQDGTRRTGRDGEAVRVPVGHENAAAGPGFGISFLAEQLNRMIHGDFADAAVPRQGTAGRQAAAPGTDAGQDLPAERFIQGQVGRFILSHLVL